MSSYTMTLLALLGALIAQSWATGLATERFLRKEQSALARRSWMALAIASLIFALQHGYALELAVSTGLHDLRQAVLAGVASLLLALAVYGLRRPAWKAPFSVTIQSSRWSCASGRMLSMRLISKPTPTAKGRGASAASVRSK